MKKILGYIFCALSFLSCTKELVYEANSSDFIDSYSVNVIEPGTLGTLLPSNYMEIKSLTVSGSINGSDMKILRKMCGADEYGNKTMGKTEQLDLKKVNFVRGGEPYFYYKEMPILQCDDALSSYAFGYCKQLKKLTIPQNLKTIGSQAFYECEALEELNIPETVQSIGKSTFLGCSQITSIRLPETIKALPDFMFRNCYRLKELFISDQIKSVGYATFDGCTNLEGLEALSTEALESFGAYAFSRTPIESFEIPQSMHIIPDYAFAECSHLRKVFLHENIDSIMEGAFYSSSLSGYLTLPKSISFIGQRAYYKTDISKVTIQSDITSPKSDITGSETFMACDNLKEVIIKEGCTFLELDFSLCDSLQNLELPQSLKRIGLDTEQFGGATNLFYGCKSLTELNLPANLEYIASRMFGNTSIREIYFPKQLAYIGTYAFNNCTQLEKVEMNKKITEIPQGLFSHCSALKNVAWSDQIKIIGYKAFEQCNQLKNICFSKSLTKIDSYAFNGCSSLTQISIPSTVSELGMGAFRDCQGISSVIFEGTLSKIPEECFSSCWTLSNIELPDGLTTIGAYAFSNCGMLEYIIIPEGVADIGAYSFQNDRNLKLVQLPISVKKIGEYCFMNCINLNHFETKWPNPILIDENVFEGIDLTNTILYVPLNASDEYKNSAVWNHFKLIEEI